MGSPDGEIPERSHTFFELYEMQNYTQEGIATERNIELQEIAEEARLNFLNSVLGGFLSVVAAVVGGINQFIEDLVFALKGITGGFIDLTGYFQDEADRVTDAVDTAISAASKVNITEIYNFETQEIRDKYPPNTAGGWSYLEDPAISASGRWVLRLQPAAGYPAYADMALSQKVDVAAGENLYIEWKQRRFGAPNFRCSMMMYFYDSAGVYLTRANPAAVPPLDIEEGEWITFAAQITPPVGAVKADVRAVLYEEAGLTPAPGTGWYVDDVVAGRLMPQAGVRGLEADMAITRQIALVADAAVEGLEVVADDHESRITFLESGNQIAEFPTDGTWHMPASLNWHMPSLIGGGGGGCGGCTGGAAPAGYGGGPGGWAEQVFTSAELTATVEITVGIGGIGGERRSGNLPDYGTSGTATSFGSYLTAGPGGGASNNGPATAGSGTRTDFQPFGGRGAPASGGNGSAGENGYLAQGGAGGTGNGGRGGNGVEPPPGQRGIGSGGGGGAGNTGAGGDCRGGDGARGGGGGSGGGAFPWFGPEQGGEGGRGGDGYAWVVSSPTIITP